MLGWWNVAPGPCGGKAVPSSPPCLCGTSSSDPLHIVIRGRPLRASRWLAAGKQWEPKGSGARRGDQANKQQQQHVSHSSRSGWDGLSPKRGRRGRRDWHRAGPSPPRQTLFFFLPLIHSVLFQALHYCLPWQAATGRGPSAGVCATCWGTFRAIWSVSPEILSPSPRALTFTRCSARRVPYNNILYRILSLCIWTCIAAGNDPGLTLNWMSLSPQ